MSSVVLVLTTVPTHTLADEIANTLVAERLAACVNIGPPMTSVYRWKDQMERDIEHQLVIKTTADRIAALQQRVKELHSYELPEFLVIEVAEGSDEYLKWVQTESQTTRRSRDDAKT